jgi:hypothetical protein
MPERLHSSDCDWEDGSTLSPCLKQDDRVLLPLAYLESRE